MESKLVSLFVLGLLSSALANPTPASGAPGNGTTPTTAGTGTPTSAGTGTPTSAIPPGVDCLDNSQKGVICNLPKPAALCDTVGPADASCQQIASSVNGTSPACVSKGVCSFKLPPVSPSTGTPTAASSNGTTPTTSGTTSTTTTAPTETGTTGTTPAVTGTTPTYYAEPNTGYVSCAANQPGYFNIKSCSSNGLNIVYPSGGPSTGGATPSAGAPTNAPAPGK